MNRLASTASATVVPFLLLGLQDVGGALVAGQEVLAVVGGEKRSQSLDALDDEQQVVLTAEREDGVDEVEAGTLFAQLHLQPVGEEVEEIGRLAGVRRRAAGAPRCRG